MNGTIRIRTAAAFATSIVTAVICTLLVTQAWSVDAAPGDSDSTFVPTAGCRVADTRSALAVGPRKAPLAADETYTIAIHGENGECSGPLAIPTDAVAVALNVTAVNATARSNIRVFPADLADVPLLSNLNVTAGAPPTPNKVDVKLSPDGKIKVYNFQGSVNIFIDVVGYYTNATLQELSQRVVALETAQAAGVDPTVLARIDALETSTATNTADILTVEATTATNTADVATNTADILTVEATTATNTADIATNTSSVDVLDAAQPFTVQSQPTDSVVAEFATTEIRSVTVTAPVDGQVATVAAGYMENLVDGRILECGLMDSVTSPFNNIQVLWQSPTGGDYSHLSATRVFNIAANEVATYYLICNTQSSGSATIRAPRVTAIFTPAP